MAAHEIDWAALRAAAVAAAATAYAPYSHYPVGAAAIVDDGRTVSGSNVENASYGLTLCAECSLVSDLVRSGGGRLLALVAVNANGDPIPPCGRCRQLLDEHAASGMQVALADGVATIEQLLPGAFGPRHLDHAGSGGPAR